MSEILTILTNSTCFGQFLYPSSGVFHCTHRNGVSYSKLSENMYDIHRCCVYSKKIADDGQKNCPKHVELYSKNKFG